MSNPRAKGLKENAQNFALDYTNWEKDGSNEAGLIGHLMQLEQ